MFNAGLLLPPIPSICVGSSPPPPHAALNDATDAIQASSSAFEEAFWVKLGEAREGHEFKEYFEKWLSGFKDLQTSARKSKRSAQWFSDHIAHVYEPFIAAGYEVLKRENDAAEIKANILANAFISGIRAVDAPTTGTVEHPAIAIGRAVNQINSVQVEDKFKITAELVQAALSKMSSSQIGEFANILTAKVNEYRENNVFLPSMVGYKVRKYLERIRDDKRPLELIFANSWSKTLEDYLNENVAVGNYFSPLIHRQTCRETFIEGTNTDITEELQTYADRMEKLNQKMAKFIKDFATKVPFDEQNRFIPLLDLVLEERVSENDKGHVLENDLTDPKKKAVLEAFIEAGYCVIQRESDITRILEHMFANIVISGLKIDRNAMARAIDRAANSRVVKMGKAFAEMNEGKEKEITAELVQVAMSKMSEDQRDQFQKGISNLRQIYNGVQKSEMKENKGTLWNRFFGNDETIPLNIFLKLRKLLQQIVYDPSRRIVDQIFASRDLSGGPIAYWIGINDFMGPIADLIAHAVHPNWGFKYISVPDW